MTIFFLFFPENRICHYVQIVSYGDNLHVMSKPVFWGKWEKYFEMSAEIFTQSATFNSVYKCEKASWPKGLASKK